MKRCKTVVILFKTPHWRQGASQIATMTWQYLDLISIWTWTITGLKSWRSGLRFGCSTVLVLLTCSQIENSPKISIRNSRSSFTTFYKLNSCKRKGGHISTMHMLFLNFLSWIYVAFANSKVYDPWKEYGSLPLDGLSTTAFPNRFSEFIWIS